MRKIIAILLAAVTVFISGSAVTAEDEIEIYIENNKIYINSDISESRKVFFAFYDGNGTLCGVTVPHYEQNRFGAKSVYDYREIKVWIVDDGIHGVKVIEKAAPSPSPTAAPTASAAPEPSSLPEPTPDEEEYGTPGIFYEPTAEPISAAEQDICSVSIDCTNAVKYAGIDSALLETLPKDGNMLGGADIEITDNMTAFDALKAAADKNGINLKGSSSYISGVNNLSEFSCGPLSGWMYSVNGTFPDVPMDKYAVRKGDVIKLLYTCDLGADLK